MNKEKYIPANLEILDFENRDVVTSSGGGGGFDGEVDEFQLEREDQGQKNDLGLFYVYYINNMQQIILGLLRQNQVLELTRQ